MITKPAPKTARKKAPKGEAISVAELQTLLRSAGLRSTAPRVAVLDFLHHATSPNSHGELFEALAGKGFDRATIYRNLIDLAEVGIVTRTDLGDHVWRFELKRGIEGRAHSDEHPHFVCVDCGEVSCLPGLEMRVGSGQPVPRSVGKKHVTVQLRGVCDDCA